MSHFRFALEPYISQKNRYQCPSCEKKHTFTRYIDLEKKEYVAFEVGKCDREQKCGYHFTPKEYFQSQTFSNAGTFQVDTVSSSVLKQVALKARSKKLPPSFIEQDLFQKSLNGNNTNNFLCFLESVLQDNDTLAEVKEKYKIGTSNKWKGATIFWQIDEEERIRTGKMMLYAKNTGKKKKVNWVHSILKLEEYNLNQCLFGLHLLNTDQHKAIALVESEKTAVIASIAFPEFIWMATGGLMNLKKDMLKPLANRKVILFPDAGCYDDWNRKVADLPSNIQYMISDLVEKKATPEEKQEGWDVADYVLGIWSQKIS